MSLKKIAYEQQEVDIIYKELNTNESGLSQKEANQRLARDGKNELPQKKRENIVHILIQQLLDPIVLLLVVTVIFSFIIHETVDAIAIIFIIGIDLVLGTFQEWKASKTAESLASLIKVRVKVKRDNSEQEINSSDLVIGDILLLESGNKISADARIIDAHHLVIDEASLTGESMGVSKKETTLLKEVPLAERSNMVYAGTTVLTGRATCVVVYTGNNTEIGQIASQVAKTKDTKSPLTIRMEQFSKQITLLIVIIAIVIALVLVAKQVPGKEIFLSVIALSVSAMPEGLPLARTMALTVASNQMAKKKVVVKKLNAVESLGSCTVIASDKTGTLTVNEQTAKKIVLPDDYTATITGTGYNDNGEITNIDGAKERLLTLSKCGAINNEAHLEKTKTGLKYHGDSIDIAFLALSQKLNIDLTTIIKKGQIAYESENKYAAAFYQQEEKQYCTVKGSIEKVLSFCDRMQLQEKVVPLDKKRLQKQNDTLASEGYRVIALAASTVGNYQEKEDYTSDDIPPLIFLGLVGFIDPIRPEVKESLQECKDAGIKVIMITGDHPLTAFTIAKELDLVTTTEEVTTGKDLEEAFLQGEAYFDQFLQQKKVFARVTPLDKFKIVESYKRQNEFIAVTGDGVNDAPALKSANIGVAMGSGTDVAKETADMIILNDNFTSIVDGVKEGRNAYSNIRKVSYMLLSCGLAEVLFFLLSIFCNLPMPLVAIQLLWLNIVTDGLQDFALSFEKAEKKIMQEKPKSPKEALFNKDLLTEVLLAGLSIGLVVFLVWYYLINTRHLEVTIARGYIMALMVFMQNIHVLNCRSEKDSTFHISLKKNPLILVSIASSILLQIIIMETPFLSKFLKTTSIAPSHMLLLLLLSISILITMELYKYIRYHKKEKTCH